MLEIASASLQRHLAVINDFQEVGLPAVVTASETIARALATGKKLLTFGNGGSAAEAQHLAAELINRYRMERPSLPALALTTDSSVLTSIANDYAYDQVFAKQIKGLGAEGDVALGISTSGNSPNVLAGLAAARARAMITIGLGGGDGGDMPGLCDLIILAPSNETPRIQEVHSLVTHLICELVDMTLFGRTE